MASKLAETGENVPAFTPLFGWAVPHLRGDYPVAGDEPTRSETPTYFRFYAEREARYVGCRDALPVDRNAEMEAKT